VATFIDELVGVPLPAAFLGNVELACSGEEIYPIGLRYSGGVFSTIRLVYQQVVSLFSRGSPIAFPQVADGRYPDGTYYVTTFHVLNDSKDNACQLQLQGLSPRQLKFRDGAIKTENPASFTLSSYAWEAISTAGTQSFSSGYAVLICDQPVHAQATYSLHGSSGQKLGEAAVIADRLPGAQFVIDQRQGERLAVAIANDESSSNNCSLTLLDRTAAPIGEPTTLTISSRTTVAKFVDELVRFSLPPTFLGSVNLACSGEAMYPIALRFSGEVFSTIQPVVCDVLFGCR
jgi:hypothetical protein